MEKSTKTPLGWSGGTEADRAAAAEARAPAWGGQRVLLVDDNEAICEVLLLALTDAGFAVTCAHDTAAARKALNWSGFDVVVLDVNMPGENGLSLADYAAALGAAVIFITGDPNTMTTLDLLANRKLDKPFRLVDLIAAVTDAARLPRSPIGSLIS